MLFLYLNFIYSALAIIGVVMLKEKLSIKNLSVLLVTDISGLSRIKGKIANSSNQGVNTAGYVTEQKIRQGSRGVALRLQRGVIDNKASKPTEEECKKETS